MTPYANNKALHHIDRLVALREGRQPAPVHLQLVLSDLCNHNCNFCAYRQPGYTSSMDFVIPRGEKEAIRNPDRMIPTHKAIEILSDAADMGVRAVQFTGGGEPTMHEDCASIIEVAQALGLETSLVTNGVRLDEPTQMALMKSAWVRISIDAATTQTYRDMRGLDASRSDFNLMKQNIRALVERRNMDPKSKLYIGIGFVLTKDNWLEIPAAVELAKSLCADSIAFGAVFTSENDNYYADFGNRAEELCQKAVAHGSTKNFEVLSRFRERREDLRGGSPEYSRCLYQHFTTFIGADLNLYACCVISYNQRGRIGSLKERGFRELWESQEKRHFMAGFDARKCPRCQFNQRNREMSRLLSALPEQHVNFV